MHVALSQMARLWLSVKVVSGCTVLFGSRIINCSQEETLGNLLSRLEDWASSSNKTLSRSGLTGARLTVCEAWDQYIFKRNITSRPSIPLPLIDNPLKFITHGRVSFRRGAGEGICPPPPPLGFGLPPLGYAENSIYSIQAFIKTQ